MAVAHEGSFGARLRRLREAAGLTQEELALRAGLSSDAVSRLERGQRKRPYPHTVRALADALDLSEGERDALIACAPKRSGMAFTAPSGREDSAHTLPVPPTLLIGRERNAAAVRLLLEGDETRLVTLTGPGGVGKTRLAVRVARDAAGSFPDGVAFVELAPLDNPALVLSAVSQALGLRTTGDRPLLEALRAYLREKRVLLVLDNFEHLAEAAPEVSSLVSSCPNLAVLRRNPSAIVIASGPCTKKIRFAASGIRKDRDTIRAKSHAATMCKGWGCLPKTLASLPWTCLGRVSMK